MTALVFIPAHTPPLPDDAHLTLVYAGEKAPPNVVTTLGLMASNMSLTTKAFAAKVNGLALFGTNHNEPVLLCEMTSEIALIRAAVMQFSQSEYSEFRPHVAIPSTAKVRNVKTRPRLLYFNQIALWPGAVPREGETRWWLGR